MHGTVPLSKSYLLIKIHQLKYSHNVKSIIDIGCVGALFVLGRKCYALAHSSTLNCHFQRGQNEAKKKDQKSLTFKEKYIHR